MIPNKHIQMTSDNLVSITDLSFNRGDRVIYDNLNLEIKRGQITAIMGPSGTGKTTLLRLIGGQLQPQTGDIVFDGDSIPNLNTQQLYSARMKMGMLFQSGALFNNLNVFENVAFPIREHTNLSEEIIRPMVLMKLEAVGLRGAQQLMPSELSGGMARRAALARAIALDPLMIMYDEPFAGQDPISMAVVVRLIRLLNDALDLTSVIVSHDVKEVTSIADYVYIVADGKVIGQGTPEHIQGKSSPRVEQFLNGLADGPVPFHFPARDLAEELVGITP